MILAICFRNVRGVLLPLLSVACGAIWTVGIMVLTGAAITIGTVLLPPLLIVIGST
jgi:predicted RND superfamily exporter protein